MTTTPPDAPHGAAPDGPDDPDGPAEDGPRVTRDEVRDLGRLRRATSDRMVAGVAGGLARHLDVDPLVLRVTFVVLVFFGGAGLLLYGACWLVVPDEATGTAPVRLDDRSRTIVLLVVGALAVLALVGDSWGLFWFPWPLAIIAVAVLVLLTRRGRQPVQPQQPGQPGQPGPTSADPTSTGGDAGTRGATAPPPTATPTSTPTLALPDPRRRGPVLFWFTLALAALGVGILGMVDVAGLVVPGPAYPALALGLVGLMLVVASVFGRGGGLSALGLVIAVVLAASTITSHRSGALTTAAPTTAEEVESRYDFATGHLVVDLSEVEDPADLDGRTLHLEGGVGRIELTVPDDLDVDVDARVGGPGEVEVFGERDAGIGSEVLGSHDGGDDVPTISIDAKLGVGEIIVSTR